MAARAWSTAALVALAVVPAASLGVAVSRSPGAMSSGTGLIALAVLGVSVAACLAYVGWLLDPRYLFAIAIVLAPLSGNWEQLHIPGVLAPDRLLLILGIAAVLVRVPAIRDRPALQIAPVHYVMMLAVTWAVLSANFVHTLLVKAPLLQLIETFGVIPFAVFLVAPVIYRTERDRRILLAALVTLGAYLAITQIFTMLGPTSLVFPRFIVDPNYGLHVGRGRGPFVDAVANGFALFVCAVACTIAARTWRNRRARVFAVVVAVMCVFGTLLTLERSIWVATIVGSVVWLSLDRRTRRYILPSAVVAALAVVVTLNTIPSLSEKIHQRAEDRGPVWDRRNITHAALNMIQERPLTGFGWAQFEARSRPYFELNRNFPLTAVGGAAHNFFLSYAVQLGLVGLLLWALSLILGVGGAIATRGPPELEPWRKALIPIGVFFVVMGNFVPPTVFPNLLLWLWAGTVWSARYSLAVDRRSTALATTEFRSEKVASSDPSPQDEQRTAEHAVVEDGRDHPFVPSRARAGGRRAPQAAGNTTRLQLYEFVAQAAATTPAGSLVLDAGRGDLPYATLWDHTRIEHAVRFDLDDQLTHESDPTAVPVEDRRYDAVVLIEVLEPLREPRSVFAELFRIQKPNGVLWLSTPRFYEGREQPYDFHRYAQPRLRRDLESVGFVVDDISCLGGPFGALSHQVRTIGSSLPRDPTMSDSGASGAALAAAASSMRFAVKAAARVLDGLEQQHGTISSFPKSYTVRAHRPQ